MTVSRETNERLQRYQELIGLWNRRINLVSSATLIELGKRHFEDCLQVALLTQSTKGRWVDLGSGGGLPGLVLAIAMADTEIAFSLVESDQRKAAFLRTVVRDLALTNTTIVTERIETLSPQNADYISARALAPLSKLMAYLDRHLAPTGTAFLMKGRRWKAEVEEAQKSWRFNCISHPSRTEEGAAILEISGIAYSGT